MTTQIINTTEDGVLYVGASNGDDEYLLWQKTLVGGDLAGIYFEWDTQANGKYEIVNECTVDRDGAHIVLSDATMIHFYFNSTSKEMWEHFIKGLKEIYKDNASILETFY